MVVELLAERVTYLALAKFVEVLGDILGENGRMGKEFVDFVGGRPHVFLEHDGFELLLHVFELLLDESK